MSALTALGTYLTTTRGWCATPPTTVSGLTCAPSPMVPAARLHALRFLAAARNLDVGPMLQQDVTLDSNNQWVVQ